MRGIYLSFRELSVYASGNGIQWEDFYNIARVSVTRSKRRKKVNEQRDFSKHKLLDLLEIDTLKAKMSKNISRVTEELTAKQKNRVSNSKIYTFEDISVEWDVKPQHGQM